MTLQFATCNIFLDSRAEDHLIKCVEKTWSTCATLYPQILEFQNKAINQLT